MERRRTERASVVAPGGQAGAGAAVVRRSGRRRPSGEPPPLPRRLERSGRSLLALSVAFLILWIAAVVTPLGERVTAVEQSLIETVAGARADTLTRLALALHGLGSLWVMRVMRWATVLALITFRRFRHLFVFLGASLAVTAIVTVVQFVLQRPRPLGVEILGSWEGYSHPSRPLANLTLSLVAILYTLLPPGRLRRDGRWVVAAIVAMLAIARIYLAVDHPTDALAGAVLGLAIPLLAFRLLAPSEAFPVTYRRARSAHLDVSGERGEAIRRAVEDQLGLVLVDLQPFGLSGSAGSTPLRITVKGDPDTVLFAKLYATIHLQADRWYKLGRALRYGRLEDEKSFSTVRRLVQHEDYALRLLEAAGVRSPHSYGIVEVTPEREYLLVMEFCEGAEEIDKARIDDVIVDDALRIVRRLWDAGLAHRDIKPANLLVRERQVYLIDAAFTEVRPTPWRQAVDLANVLLVLALACEPRRVLERARLVFEERELAEAFAATRGITMPSQLRRLMQARGRNLHAEFCALLPEPPQPIAISRWSVRRVLLTVAVTGGVVLALLVATTNLRAVGLL